MARRGREGRAMKPAAKRSVLPYYGVAVLWVGYALARPLYTIPSFLLVGILSLGLFLLLWEARSRYIVSFLPLLAVCGVWGLCMEQKKAPGL